MILTDTMKDLSEALKKFATQMLGSDSSQTVQIGDDLFELLLTFDNKSFYEKRDRLVTQMESYRCSDGNTIKLVRDTLYQLKDYSFEELHSSEL